MKIMDDKRRPRDYENLRREAEDRLRSGYVSGAGQMSEADVRSLLHELQVHQIELEMQNEELQRAKMEAEDAARKYSDLYDFAPISYLTLDEDHKVIEANLAAEQMLGVPRSELIGVEFQILRRARKSVWL